MNQKGISLIAIILIIVGVLAVAGGVWYWQSQKEKPAACTQDTKLCPDDSYVSRTGPNCEFAACPEVKDETADWKTYSISNVGLSINYPSGWILQDYSEYLTQDEGNDLRASLTILSPKENASDTFQENLSITVMDNTRHPITLNEADIQLIEMNKAVMKDFSIIGPVSSINFDGNPAHKITYSGKDPNAVNLKVMVVHTIKNNKLYSFAFIAEVDKYDKFIDIIQIILDSIKIK